MALDKVSDYVADARVLLQDTYAGTGGDGYRYPDAELVTALNHGLMEARRIRPDLFLNTTTFPSYSAVDQTKAVAMDLQYRVTLLYYIVGRAALKDDETTQDARSAILLNKFVSQLLTVQS